MCSRQRHNFSKEIICDFSDFLRQYHTELFNEVMSSMCHFFYFINKLNNYLNLLR